MSWSKHFPPNEDSYYDHMFLETPVGTFKIEWKSWKYPYYDYTIYLAPTGDPKGEIYIDTGSSLENAQYLVRQYLVRLTSPNE